MFQTTNQLCVEYNQIIITGWWYTYPSENYKSQSMGK